MREVADALLAPGDDAATAAGLSIAGAAAVDLLPDWAAAMHRRQPNPLLRPAIRTGAGGLSRMVRWSLRLR